MKNIFIENSYACSPAPPKTDEKITNIEIYTNNDYNSMNPVRSKYKSTF